MSSPADMVSEGTQSFIRILRIVGRRPVCMALEFLQEQQQIKPLRFVQLNPAGDRHAGARRPGE